MAQNNVLLTLSPEVKEVLEAQAKANMRSGRMEMTYLLTQAAMASPFWRGAQEVLPEKPIVVDHSSPEDIV